jgi:UDP-N-acetylmuramyl pentapeptide synthase
MERRIYSSWAFSDGEREKAKINSEIYKELKEKAIVVYREDDATEDLKRQKSVLLDFKHGYAHTDYKILSNPHKLSTVELALVCDGGNLCFGYRTSGSIITIHTD